MIAIDVGTSSVRASAVGLDGQVYASHGVSTPAVLGGGGRSVLDAEECARLMFTCIRAVSAAVDVIAVGVAAQLGSVLIDGERRALEPVRLWSDTTAHPYVDRVVSSLAESGAPVVGRRIAAEHSAPRLLGLIDHESGLVGRASAYVSLKDYLNARLTGEIATDPTHASYSALFDVATGRWAEDFAESLGIPRRLLPPVRGAAEAVGTISQRAAQDSGLRAGIPVAVGGPDGTIGALGAGAIEPGMTVDIAGTTDVLVQVIDRPIEDASSVVTTNLYGVDGLWTVGGATGMTGGFLGWLAGFLGASGVEELHDRWADQLDAAPPGANGVLVDPALTGHRFPYWGRGSGGGVRGLTPTRSQADVIAAAHEGGAFLVADGLAALARVAERPTRVIVVGGVAKRAASLQLRADVWGVQVAGVSDGMATSRGAAILAGLAAGAFAAVGAAAQALVPEVETYTPVEDRTDVYRAMRQRWRSAFFGNDRIDLS